MRENDDDAAQGALPINDARWQGFALEGRYASILAHRAGLSVRIEDGLVEFPSGLARKVWIERLHGAAPATADTHCSFITWTGTEAQFRASGYFTGTGPFPRKRRWSYPEGLRGYLWRTSLDEFTFVIEFVTTNAAKLANKRVSRALADADYRAFRDRLVSPSLSSE